MATLTDHINSFIRGEISDFALTKHFLSRIESLDFIFPARKLEQYLHYYRYNKNVQEIILNVISKQNKIYTELKNKFLSVENVNQLADLLFPIKTEEKYKLFLDEIWEKDKYSYFYIPKKSGGFRQISKPKNFGLIHIQASLNFYLNLVYEPNENSHGFIWKRNILTNAKNHVGKNYILNIDIKDFFPSVDSNKILKLFSTPPFNFNSNVCKCLNKICCDNNHLPQGAATSPIITNFICMDLDRKLRLLAKEMNVIYTRYADDITFSSNDAIFYDDFRNKIESMLNENGFNINNKKYRIQNKRHRQEVTGLVVNEKPNINRKYIRNLRALLHSYKIDDIETFIKKFNIYYGRYKCNGIPDYINYIKGKINFIGLVRGKNDELYLKFKNTFEAINREKNDGR